MKAGRARFVCRGNCVCALTHTKCCRITAYRSLFYLSQHCSQQSQQAGAGNENYTRIVIGSHCHILERLFWHPVSRAQRGTVHDIIFQQSYLLLFGIPSPTHSFIPDLKPSFFANLSHRSPSFFFFGIHYMYSPDCLLLLLSISVLTS